MSLAEVPVDQAGILKSLPDVLAVNFGIHVTVNLHNIRPAVVVVIDEAATPCDILIIDSDAGRKCHVAKSSIAIVVVKIASIVREVGFKNVEPAVTVIIGNADAHAGLFVAIFAVRDSRNYRHISERAIVIVSKQNAGLRIHGDVNVRPSIVVEIVGHRSDGIFRSGLQDSSFF